MHASADISGVCSGGVGPRLGGLIFLKELVTN